VELWRKVESLLNKVNAVTCKHRHGQPLAKKHLDNLSNRQLEFEEFWEQYKQDNIPRVCYWTYHSYGAAYEIGCNHRPCSNDAKKEGFEFCPYCGNRIIEQR